MSNPRSVRSKGVTTSDPPPTDTTYPIPLLELGPRRDSGVGVNDVD